MPNAAMMTRMDPDALSILIRNLVENAARHGDEGKPVRLTVGTDGLLSVVSHGPVVPAEHLATLTKPFERSQTTARGTGLGLAIVDAIARGARTRLTLASPAVGFPDGFEARVALG